MYKVNVRVKSVLPTNCELIIETPHTKRNSQSDKWIRLQMINAGNTSVPLKCVRITMFEKELKCGNNAEHNQDNIFGKELKINLI